MNDQRCDDGRLDRRAFLRRGLGMTAGVVGCLQLGLPAALAAARRGGKPVLTDASLNRLIARHRKAGDLDRLVRQAARDPLAFLEGHFTVTPAQRASYRALTSRDIQTLKRALGQVARGDAVPRMAFVPGEEAGDSGVRVSTFSAPGGPGGEGTDIVIIKIEIHCKAVEPGDLDPTDGGLEGPGGRRRRRR